MMLRIKVKSVNSINGIFNSFEEDCLLNKKYIWIGRGEEVKQKLNQKNDVVSLRDLSKSVSRIHACIIVSPFYFAKNQSIFPTYYQKLSKQWKFLPGNILTLIRQFSRPTKDIILKDCQSKSGIFKKITHCIIQAGTQIILGDNKKIAFQHREIYNSPSSMMERIQELKNSQYTVFKEESLSYTAKSFWIISSKNERFILCDENIKIQFGRSSSCDYVIANDASISRKHAYMLYDNGIWTLFDGDGQSKSSSGLWKKMKKIVLNDSKTGLNKQKNIKFGDFSLSFTLKQPLSLYSMKYLCQSTNSSSNSQNQKSLELQKSLSLSKKSSI